MMTGMRRAMPDIRGQADSSEKNRLEVTSSARSQTRACCCAISKDRRNPSTGRSKPPERPDSAFILLNCSNRLRLWQSNHNQDGEHPGKTLDADITIRGSTWVDTPLRAPHCLALSVF